MTVLAYQHIRDRCIKDGLINPWSERMVHRGMTYGLGPSGYDIRIAESLLMFDGEFRLASSIEKFNMPDDLVARVCDKSSLARRGLFVQNTIIEPGWRGFLTLELTVHGQMLRIEAGTPIAQIMFEVLSAPTELPYAGKYQDQTQGVHPAREEGSA